MAVESIAELIVTDPRRIAVIGDALIDVWVSGTLQPSQDGCDKFIETDRRTTSGGALNAANCLSSWNIQVDVFVHSGKGQKIRYLADGRIVFRHDMDILADPCHRIDISPYDAILLSDYDKGFLLPSFIKHIADSSLAPVVVDAKREPRMYKGCIVKGNKEYLLKYGAAHVVTDGPNVPLVRGKPVLASTSPVPCINHVGAGDCFAAHLTLALAYGFSLAEAAAFAHSAGRVYVQEPYNQAPEKDKVIGDFLGVS